MKRTKDCSVGAPDFLPGTPRRTSLRFAFFAVVLLICELALHLFAFSFNTQLLFAVGFTLAVAALLTLVTQLAHSPRVNAVLTTVLLAVVGLHFSVQTVYFRIFSDLMPASVVSMGGEAINGFYSVMFHAILSCLPLIVLYFLPIPAFYLLRRRAGWLSRGQGKRCNWLLLPFAAVFAACSVVPMQLSPGAKRAMTSSSTGMSRRTAYFGLITAQAVDLYDFCFRPKAQIDASAQFSGPHSAETALNADPDLDFDALETAADTEARRELSRYFAQKNPTNQNDYTGLFEGCSVIDICCESACLYMIDPELTPTLYRLTHEGIVLKNFYNSFPAITSNGEYCMISGLMPSRASLSLASSMDKYYPYVLGRALPDQTGAKAFAYHNNVGTFYNRINVFPNFGYDFKAIGCGLDMERTLPTSDLEMMEKTMDEYVHENRFVVHYMSYSGHAPYDFDGNVMAAKNRDAVAGVKGSSAVKAYLAGQLELEKAVACLVDRLEAEGILDRTVIVLTADHYPYGLLEDDYAGLAGAEASENPFWKYHSFCTIWKGGMETVEVEDYCCTQDILPTVLNLLGLKFDSRLLTGTDLFSDAEHVAILENGSFVNTKVRYDSTTETVDWFCPESERSDEYFDRIMGAVNNCFTIGGQTEENDYYRFAFQTLGLADTETSGTTRSMYLDTVDKWYEQEVNDLTQRGAITGRSDGLFYGENPAQNNAEVAMLSRLLKLEPVPDIPFQNVLLTTSMGKCVSAAWAAGLIDGAETFDGGVILNLEQISEMMRRAAVCVGVEDPEAFTRAALERTVAEAAKNGEEITAAGMTRGQLAYFVAQLIPELEAH